MRDVVLQNILYSIPDAPGAMMRDQAISLRLSVLDRIIQEKVNQDGVDASLGLLAQDLSSDQLHSPDAAASQLDLPRMPALDGFPLPDMAVQRWAVLQNAQRVQHLRDPVIWFPIFSPNCVVVKKGEGLVQFSAYRRTW